MIFPFWCFHVHVPTYTATLHICILLYSRLTIVARFGIYIYNWVEGTQKRVKIFKIVYLRKPREIFDHSFFLYMHEFPLFSLVFLFQFSFVISILYKHLLLFFIKMEILLSLFIVLLCIFRRYFNRF